MHFSTWQFLHQILLLLKENNLKFYSIESEYFCFYFCRVVMKLHKIKMRKVLDQYWCLHLAYCLIKLILMHFTYAIFSKDLLLLCIHFSIIFTIILIEWLKLFQHKEQYIKKFLIVNPFQCSMNRRKSFSTSRLKLNLLKKKTIHKIYRYFKGSQF